MIPGKEWSCSTASAKKTDASDAPSLRPVRPVRPEFSSRVRTLPVRPESVPNALTPLLRPDAVNSPAPSGSHQDYHTPTPSLLA